MTQREVTLTIKKMEESGPLIIEIENAEFLTKENNTEAVEKILFCNPPSERGDIKNTLESKKPDGSENKTFVLKYDDEHLEIDKDEGGFMSMASEKENPKHGPKPLTKHLFNKWEKRIKNMRN